jgi:hypothetical protein
MKWLWIDPGETVGWQTGLVLGTEEPRLQLLDHGNTASQPFLLTLLTAAVKYDLIGYESYQIRQDKAQAHVGSHVPTLQVIGGIRLCAWAQLPDGGGAACDSRRPYGRSRRRSLG